MIFLVISIVQEKLWEVGKICVVIDDISTNFFQHVLPMAYCIILFVGSLQWSQESYVYWLMLGKTEKLILVILSVEAFIVVSAACLSGNIYRWNTPVLSSSICTAVAPCWDTYMWTVRWCCKSLRIRLSNFSTLQMTWNMAWAIFSTGDK